MAVLEAGAGVLNGLVAIGVVVSVDLWLIVDKGRDRRCGMRLTSVSRLIPTRAHSMSLLYFSIVTRSQSANLGAMAAHPWRLLCPDMPPPTRAEGTFYHAVDIQENSQRMSQGSAGAVGRGESLV